MLSTVYAKQEASFLVIMIVRSPSNETHRALKLRAAQHGRSLEAEIRDVLDQTLRPPTRIKLGSALAELGQTFGGIELDVLRDTSL